MPDSQLYTREAAMTKAGAIKTALASSKLRLCKAPITITVYTLKSALVAAEADFSGYTAGGYALAAWTGPGINPVSGAVITSPLVNPAFATPAEDPPVGNQIGGWWIEDSTGKVRLAGMFDPTRSMEQDGDTFPFVAQIVEGFNLPTPVE